VICQRVEARSGLRVAAIARSLEVALETLMRDVGVERGALEERLLTDDALLERLTLLLTIPETHFFRVKPQMKALANVVLPTLARDRASIRVWSAGCSTGEEAYTLAMLALEGQGPAVSVLGTDLHPGSLEVARAARYGAWSFRDTPPHVRQMYFDAVASARWQVKPEVRDLVKFAALNLLEAHWTVDGTFDLIVCRNVMIYFSNDNAQRLIARLAARLRPGGWLLLGPSDPPPLPATLQRAGLVVRFEDGAILYRRAALRAVTPDRAPAPPPAVPKLEPRAPNAPTLELPVFIVGALDTVAPAAQTDAPSDLHVGLSALEGDDLPLALAALRRAAYLEPTSAFVQFALAQALVSSGQSARARSALRAAARLLEGLSDDAALSGQGMTVADLRRGVQALNVMLGA
jgi:chemotaxis protein methyltransferase CheR